MELSMGVPGVPEGSSAVPVTTCQLRGWTRPEGAGFSDSEGALGLLSSLECPRFQGGQAGLVGGHTQVDFRTKLQGVGKLHVYKEIEQAEIGTGFFFQAEDGIRDRNVTGVQTCALPI